MVSTFLWLSFLINLFQSKYVQAHKCRPLPKKDFFFGNKGPQKEYFFKKKGKRGSFEKIKNK